MGMYDTFGELGIQLKNGECLLGEFSVGDEVSLDDGIYVGYEGFVVIYKGRFVAEFPSHMIFDKWGETIPIDINERNPMQRVVSQIIRENQSNGSE